MPADTEKRFKRHDQTDVAGMRRAFGQTTALPRDDAKVPVLSHLQPGPDYTARKQIRTGYTNLKSQREPFKLRTPSTKAYRGCRHGQQHPGIQVKPLLWQKGGMESIGLSCMIIEVIEVSELLLSMIEIVN
jgi:hypothetical protein